MAKDFQLFVKLTYSKSKQILDSIDTVVRAYDSCYYNVKRFCHIHKIAGEVHMGINLTLDILYKISFGHYKKDSGDNVSVLALFL